MDVIAFFNEELGYFLLTIGFVSIFIGSFLNVVIYRLPRMMDQSWSEECRIYLGLKPQVEPEKLSLALPPSHCPHCKKPIKPWHNIPILSYLWLQGKCADCGTPISMRYPFVEALTCILSVYIAMRFGVTWQMIGALFFTWICICLTFIDLDHQLLPDQLTLLLLWLGLFFSLFNLFTNSHDAIIGAIAGYSIFALTQYLFFAATGKTGMGQGDYKFLAGIAGFLGWQMIPFVILIASLTGIIFALTQMTLKRSFKSTPIPFGPYLAVAGWIALIWGDEVLNAYLQLF